MVPPVPVPTPTPPTIPGARDPNDELGPSGYGPSNFVPEGTLLPYRIDFENTPTATAPAQTVTVSDQLPPTLDWSSFTLSEIGFADTILAIPAGSQHYTTSVSMTYNGTTFDVQIEAGVHTDTGEVYARFESIDPGTDLPPQVLAGFLPPEDGTGRGTGHISYTILPKAGLATGTEVRNVAAITFDQNAAITTDQVDDEDPGKGVDPAKQALVTIDSVSPTSSVASLPSFSPATFIVRWAGQDDSGGSGIASYTVAVSDNGGDFKPWLTDTTQTSATYHGEDGHRYAFYSIATDNVRNMQATPDAPQATTTVDAVAPSSTVNPLPSYSVSSFAVSWTGEDNAGGSGLAYYDVWVSDNGGALTKWLGQTTDTSAVYSNILPGHTYRFYTRATDNAGNTEAAPVQPEARTQVLTFRTVLTEPAGTARPTAQKITALLGTHYTDPDGGTHSHPGIAVFFTSGAGSWQYSTNGLSWTTIAPVSMTGALLLPQADQLRFLPAGLGTMPADLLFTAWDGSAGTAGHYVNIASADGATPFGIDAAELSVTLKAVTQAPVWLASGITLTPVLPGGANDGETVAQAFGSVFSGDQGQAPGIAIVGATRTKAGSWQYARAGSPTQFTAMPRPGAGSAFLLSANDRVRFVPTGSSFVGQATLAVHAWDGSGGFADGSTIKLSKSGGTTPFSSTVLTARLYFNHAPTQNAGSITLSASAENAPSKPVSVATLLKDVQAADTDKNTLGLALTGDNGNGTWQYELPGGVWRNVPATVTEAAALLLPGTALLRFSPTANQSGSATLIWEAWDGTTNEPEASGTGGATAFSSNQAHATLTVTPSTHPPVWNGSGAALTPVLPNTREPEGNTVASIFGAYFSDPNVTSMGIAISGVTGTNSGQWKYSTDGGATWNNLPAVSAGQALLLFADDLLTFIPITGFLGTVSLTAYAWDGNPASGSHGSMVRVHGSDFSSTTVTASCLVNTAPTLSN